MQSNTSTQSTAGSQTQHSAARRTVQRDWRLAAWLLFALGCGFLAYTARLHEITHDAFHEMSLFRESLALGYVPTHDLFAFTPTVNPSVHHEWATGAVLYYASVGTGLGAMGLSLLKYALIAALWWMLYRVARLRGAHPYMFATVALLVFPCLWVGFATIRAQLFTLVFIAAQLWMQELDYRGRRAWILVWLVMLVAWLNLHAGFVVGLGLIAFHSLERFGRVLLQDRSLLAAFHATWHLMLAAPVAALLLQINPYGWQYIPYLIHAIGMERPTIREWLPLWHTHAPLWTMTAFVLATGLFIYCQRVVRFERLRGASFLAVATYMALKHIRHGSIFAVIWIAYVPAWLSRTSLGKHWIALLESNRFATKRVAQGFAAVTLLFAICHQFWQPTVTGTLRYSAVCYPTGAVQYLKANDFRGNLLTPFHAGSYVSWEMYPQVKVSLDGRYEVAFQPEVMPEHEEFFAAKGRWWELPEKYPADAILVHQQSPLASQLRWEATPESSTVPPQQFFDNWGIVYEDPSYVVLAAKHGSLATSAVSALPASQRTASQNQLLHRIPKNAAHQTLAPKYTGSRALDARPRDHKID